MVQLRELCMADLAIINQWRNNPDLIASLIAPFRYINLETDQSWFEHYMGNRSANVRCVILNDETPAQVVGAIGLTEIDFVSRKAGYYIMIGDEKQQGKGIGMAATQQILKHAFDNLNLNRVELQVLERNQRAIGLYEKVGFRREGLQRQGVFKNGQYLNVLIMSILQEDYR